VVRSDFGRGGGLPDTEVLEVTEQEEALALASLRADETFIVLTDNTTWSVAERRPNIDGRTGSKAGVALVIALDTPVSASGPWRALHCQGTVVQKFEFPYTGISALQTVSNLDGELQALSPLFFESYPSDAKMVELEGCPIGFEDEEN
jgi:hypothetical protein